MANKPNQTWNVFLDGENHKIELRLNMWSGKHQVYVDSVLQNLVYTATTNLLGLDQEIKIGEKTGRIVIVGRKADIVIDGYYLGSKKMYLPRGKMPIWSWLFIAVCIYIPIDSRGGMLPAMLAFLGAIFCARFSVSSYDSTGIKILKCVGTTLITWTIYIAFVYLWASLDTL